jgi:hypothetical protein
MNQNNHDLTPIFEQQAAEILQRAASSFSHRSATSSLAFARAAMITGVMTLYAAHGERETRAIVDAIVKAEIARRRQTNKNQPTKTE